MSRPLLVALAVSVLAHVLMLARPVWQSPPASDGPPPPLQAQLQRKAVHANPPAAVAATAPQPAVAAPKPPPLPAPAPAIEAPPPSPAATEAVAPPVAASEPVSPPPPEAPAVASAPGLPARHPEIADLAAVMARHRQGNEEAMRRAASLIAYRQDVARAARDLKRYPVAARARGLAGVVVIGVRATVDTEADAKPRVSIVRGSGASLLDDAALLLIEQAVELVELPPGLRGRPFQFALPVEYALDE